MIRLNNRFARIILLLLSSTILTFTSFSLLALAQEPSPFEINVKPAADYAVRGQVFPYTVTVTNTSETPVKTAFVNVDVPDGTKFLDTHYTDLKWYGGRPFFDPEVSVEKITLFTPEIIEPGEVFTFTMYVELLPETTNQIVVESYEIGGTGREIFTTGTSLETQVIEPTPTSLPTVPPSPVPVTTLTLNPTPAAIISTPTTTTKNTPDSQDVVDSEISNSAPVGTESPETAIPIVALGILGLGLVIVLIAIGWFLRRK